MTNEIKKNKALRIFTFTLVTITIVGIPITLFITTDYAKAYTLWLKRTYAKIAKIYNNLSDAQKSELKKHLEVAEKTSRREVKNALVKIGVDGKIADKIISTGSVVVKEVVAKTEKKITS